MPDYSSPLYWQERYAHDPSASFDWYLTYDDLRPHLAHLLARARDPDFEVFIPGCGNSSLGARLYTDGYVNISNVDISSVVISQVRDRFSDMSEMDFSVLDVCDMHEELPDPCFDLVRFDRCARRAAATGTDRCPPPPPPPRPTLCRLLTRR